MSAQENKQRIRELVEIFNRGDLDGYLARYADDAAVHGLPAELQPTKEGLTQFVQAVAVAFPDIQFTVHELIAEGDRVAFRGQYHATHRGDFAGVPPTGNRVEFEGMSTFRFSGDALIAERAMLLDTVALLSQLGLTPQPAPAAALT